jgi:hypothetical protein
VELDVPDFLSVPQDMARSGILLAFSIFSIVSVTAHADLRITSWSPEGGPSSGGTTVLMRTLTT